LFWFFLLLNFGFLLLDVFENLLLFLQSKLNNIGACLDVEWIFLVDQENEVTFEWTIFILGTAKHLVKTRAA
jgi:hypothetical protein